MDQLIVKDLSIGYDKKIIRRNINFHIQKGDYLCIIGENGCGKSTLLKTLLGLIPLIQGKIKLANNLSISYLAQQNSIPADFPASVQEVVFSGFIAHMKWRPFYTRKEKEIASFYIHKLGLSALLNTSFGALSGGQKQRVLLARALCLNPDILFLDEPTAGLDHKITDDLYQLIDTLNEHGLSIVMITHDQKYAMKRASHILSFTKSIFFGTVQEYVKGDQS